MFSRKTSKKRFPTRRLTMESLAARVFLTADGFGVDADPSLPHAIVADELHTSAEFSVGGEASGFFEIVIGEGVKLTENFSGGGSDAGSDADADEAGNVSDGGSDAGSDADADETGNISDGGSDAGSDADADETGNISDGGSDAGSDAA